MGPKLATNIEMSTIDFKNYIKKYETVQSERDLTVNEFIKAFFRLKQTRISVMTESTAILLKLSFILVFNQ